MAINSARQTIRSAGYNDGYEEGVEDGRDEVRNGEDHFRVPCFRCGEDMRFSNADENWPKERESLNQAFSAWFHRNCQTDA